MSLFEIIVSMCLMATMVYLHKVYLVYSRKTDKLEYVPYENETHYFEKDPLPPGCYTPTLAEKQADRAAREREAMLMESEKIFNGEKVD